MISAPRFVVVGALAVTLGCQQGHGHDVGPAAPTPMATLSAAPSSTTVSGLHFRRFKMTSAKPSEVEPAMAQGWRLINCSVARGGAQAGGSLGVYTIEHCYFEGDEHVVDVDGGAPVSP